MYNEESGSILCHNTGLITEYEIPLHHAQVHAHVCMCYMYVLHDLEIAKA